MPLSVTPSKQLIIDTDNGEAGDILRLVLEDRQSLYLTLQVSEHGYASFTIESRFFPTGLVSYVKSAMKQLLFDDYRLSESFEKREDQTLGLYDWLYAELASNVYVSNYEVDEIPTISLGAPGWLRLGHDFKKWQASSSVRTIATSTEWVATIWKARLMTEE